MSTLPRSLFVYDYDLNLIKIINMPFPLLRLCGDFDSDDCYIIGANPEFEILKILLQNPKKVFTREEILSHIWGSAGNFVNDNTLTVTIKRLREKIGDKEGNIIVTVRGVGYRLSD